MAKLFSLLPQIAESHSTVLLEGASGTGKEIFARAIHNNSKNRNGPFVAINCGALPDTLCESELFGYKAGAFTDAKKDKPGRFAMAQNGTIFLDEISDISKAVQIRLLRVLEEKVSRGSLFPNQCHQTVLADAIRKKRRYPSLSEPFYRAIQSFNREKDCRYDSRSPGGAHAL